MHETYLKPAAVWGRMLLLLLAFGLVACQSAPAGKRQFSEAQVAALVRAGFTQSGESWGLNLDGRILFARDTDDLTPEARQTIRTVVEALKAVDIEHLQVEGHTDNTGNPAYNMELSRRRAESVAREIQSYGFQPGAIQRRAYGSSRPIADNGSPEGQAQNRRVTLIAVAE